MFFNNLHLNKNSKFNHPNFNKIKDIENFISKGNFELIDYFLIKSNIEGVEYALEFALYYGNIDIVKKIISKFKILQFSLVKYLQTTCSANKFEAFKYIIETCNANKIENQVLIDCVIENKLNYVQYLLNSGNEPLVDINCFSSAALKIAISKNYNMMCILLVSNGAKY